MIAALGRKTMRLFLRLVFAHLLWAALGRGRKATGTLSRHSHLFSCRPPQWELGRGQSNRLEIAQ